MDKDPKADLDYLIHYFYRDIKRDGQRDAGGYLAALKALLKHTCPQFPDGEIESVLMKSSGPPDFKTHLARICTKP